MPNGMNEEEVAAFANHIFGCVIHAGRAINLMLVELRFPVR